MEVKSAWTLLVVAGVLLLGGVRGDSHDGSHQCNLTQVAACATTDFATKLQKLDEVGDNVTSQQMKDACGVYKMAMDCVKKAHCTEQAFVGLIGNGLDQFDVNQYCNDATYCYLDMATCTMSHADVFAYLNSTKTFDQNWCPRVQDMMTCLHNSMPKRCMISSGVKPLVQGVKTYLHYCHEMSCAPLQTCRQTFNDSGPIPSGLDAKTCMLFRNYTRCAGGAISSCSDVMSPKGQPAPGKISDIVAQACTLMEAPEIVALYSCSAFTTCINDLVAKLEDILFIPNLCRTTQGTIGCAVKTAQSCGGIQAADANTFVDTAKHLALRAAGMGCGAPMIDLQSCTQLQSCKMAFAGVGEGATFQQSCMAMKTFQSCADTATKACNISIPEQPMHKHPKLGQLSTVTEKMCNAMKGGKLETCMDYMQCLASASMPDGGSSDGEFISGKSWCGVSVQSLQCAQYYSEDCAAPPELKQTLGDIYKEILGTGCEDTFDYLTGDGGDDDTTDNGAQTLVGASLVYMLLLSLVHSILRLL